jgi:hypothetical protein
VKTILSKWRYFPLNFFVQAVDDPQLIVDFLSIYKDPELDIEREIIQLVYHANLSYYDVNMMSSKIRRFWMEEIQRILQEKSKNATETSLHGMGAF